MSGVLPTAPTKPLTGRMCAAATGDSVEVEAAERLELCSARTEVRAKPASDLGRAAAMVIDLVSSTSVERADGNALLRLSSGGRSARIGFGFCPNKKRARPLDVPAPSHLLPTSGSAVTEKFADCDCVLREILGARRASSFSSHRALFLHVVALPSEALDTVRAPVTTRYTHVRIAFSHLSSGPPKLGLAEAEAAMHTVRFAARGATYRRGRSMRDADSLGSIVRSPRKCRRLLPQ
jgi:hypothetical protein